MSIQAKLLIDDIEVNVLRFHLEFNQQSDINGRPLTKPVFNGLSIIIETRKDLDFTDWATAPNQTKQLELHITPRVLGSKTRKLYFYDCHLLHWKNNFRALGKQPMSEKLSISCGGVKDSQFGAEYSAHWRVTYPSNNVVATTINRNEKKITKYYLTNTDGDKIDDYKKDDIIIVNIETKNRIGDSVTINLNDAEYDFEYNGNSILNDTLKDIPIDNDLEQIELKVVEQKQQTS
ncbi:type VI secretion system tube protein TssD [uncultured Algibacter sp.]|uniref:type VI secretion system tube protein TssD n=1 Tax=uncultured Algibacter sp. TaxID=298659 RepID=UPI00321629AF